MNRRGFLSGLFAAPAVITTPGLLMPVRALPIPPPILPQPQLSWRSVAEELINGRGIAVRFFDTDHDRELARQPLCFEGVFESGEPGTSEARGTTVFTAPFTTGKVRADVVAQDGTVLYAVDYAPVKLWNGDSLQVTVPIRVR